MTQHKSLVNVGRQSNATVVISWTNAGKRRYGDNHWFWAAWDVEGVPDLQWNKSVPAECGFCESEKDARRAAWGIRSRGYRRNWWASQYLDTQHQQDTRPAFSRCRSGRRWFWVVTTGLFEEPRAEGYAETADDALTAAVNQVGEVQTVGNWRAQGVLRQRKAEERRKKMTAEQSAHRLEFVYEMCGRDCFDRHRIVRRTKKRIFVELDSYSDSRKLSGDWWDWDISTVVFDRAEFEREGKVWCRRLRCFLYASQEVYLEERGAEAVPECFAALGVGTDATAADVKRAYRRLAKDHHPDNGGDPNEFKRVRRFYEEAMGRVAG